MKLLLHVKKTILPAFLLIAGFCVSQNTSLDILRNSISKLDLDESKSYLKSIDTTILSKYDKGLWYFYNGLNHRSDDDHDKGFLNLLKAEKLFKELDSLKDAADTNYEIIILLSHQENNQVNIEPFLNKYIAYAKSQKNPLILARAYSRVASNYMQVDSFQKSQDYYLKTFNQIEKIQEENIREISNAKIKLNYGSLYRTVSKEIGGNKEYDSALYFYKKALPILLKYKLNNDIATTYNNIGYSYFGKNEFKRATNYYKKADSIPLKEYNAKTKIVFYKNMAEAYDSLKDYKNVTLYLNKFIQLKDSINNKEQNKAIADINTKYKTAEKDKENAELKADKAQTNIYLTIALAVLALVIISAYLIQKNTRKKQLLAEQQQELEAQKVENLLQEQELASIDAMIAGQEKERQRIAEDLHDDLGGLMATIQLHLDNVGTENSPNALKKTKLLLNEAYQKIRSISHIRNAGVMANKGLLVAVNDMANKVTAANKIDIEVIDSLQDQRLENSLELSLFRIIQELTTNIIKHAKATKATIQLTQHPTSLNIMVTDNGIGFDTNMTSSGIGLENIQKRVEHLHGNFTIDSFPQNGTTIVIDVPLG